MIFGVIRGIYRDGDPHDPGNPTPYVVAKLNSGGLVRATYAGSPPPPLSTCVFWSDGGVYYHVLGTYGLDVRPVLREHFLTVPTTTADGAVACDTPWTLDVSGASSQVAQAASSGLGVARLTAGNAVGRSATLQKTALNILASSADGFWMSARIQVGSTSDVDLSLGLDGSTEQSVFYSSASTAYWELVSGSATFVPTATVVATSTYYWADIVTVPGGFCALWVSGDGPYVETVDVVSTSGELFPYARVISNTTATKTFDVDNYFLDAIDGEIVHPTSPLLKA